MSDLTPTKPGYYWAQWRKAVPGTRDAAELTPSDDWQPVQVFENTLDDQHPEYLMVEVGGVEKAQSLDCFVWGPAIPPFVGQGESCDMELFEGQLRKVVDASRQGWWRFHEHYDRNGYCDNPARGY